jgi:hypothetical protein
MSEIDELPPEVATGAKLRAGQGVGQGRLTSSGR